MKHKMFCKNCGNSIDAGKKFCTNCGIYVARSNFPKPTIFTWFKNNMKWLGLAVLGISIVVGGGIYFKKSRSHLSNQILMSSDIQKEIAASVVNILCPSIQDDEISSGSGTILTQEGMVLTNSHVIPQDEESIFVDDDGCIVVLPDPETGQPSGMYLAHPISIPGLSDEYDLAYLDIYAAYYNEDDKEYAGVYPRKFPAFDDSARCKDENIQLGEPVRIFGYPGISGGYSLTITDGVVSSFSDDDLIYVSAKISYGNSGGLAVDRRGCMIGIPSMVSVDDAESLGVLISMPLINEFSEKVDQYLEE